MQGQIRVLQRVQAVTQDYRERTAWRWSQPRQLWQEEQDLFETQKASDGCGRSTGEKRSYHLCRQSILVHLTLMLVFDTRELSGFNRCRKAVLKLVCSFTICCASNFIFNNIYMQIMI